MLFGFGHLVFIMSALHPEVDAGIVEARLKYLQRVPFPSEEPRVGRGGRLYYSADDLMKVVAVFELLAAGILPTPAAALVRERWDPLAAGLGKAWSIRSRPVASLVLIARVDALDERGEGAGVVSIGSDADVVDWLRSEEAGDRRMTVVDLVRVAKALDVALEADNPVLEFIAMRRELDQWAGERRRILRTGT